MFVKLFTQILDSSIADDRRLRHFFTDLLLCADPKGYVSMTGSAIARRIGASMEEVTWGLDQLSSPDPWSKTPDFEGRRIERLEGTGYGWRIINFENYKAMKSADDMREKTKERVRKFRENKQLQGKPSDVTLGNDDVTLSNASNPIQRQRQMQMQIKKKEVESKEQKINHTAETIYQAYPRKVAKPDALKAITKAMKRIDPAVLLERTEAYANATAWQERQFIPHPATWFNGERFNDDESGWQQPTNQSSPASPPKQHRLKEYPQEELELP